jgi:hypothetical protein
MPHLGRRERTLIVAFAVLLIITAIAFLAFNRVCLYEYKIVATRLSPEEVPANYLNLTAQDIAEHPIIGRVQRAYDDASVNPVAYHRDGTLYFPVRPNERIEAVEANDFLVTDWGARPYPVMITTGDGSYYAWALLVTDPGELLPCS